MPTERITQLEEFYKEDPHDPFNAYALALEYMNEDPARSGALFGSLLDRHPDYLPTYYHAAKFFEHHGDRERAAGVFEKGIALAQRLRDDKTLRELRSAYDEMMFE